MKEKERGGKKKGGEKRKGGKKEREGNETEKKGVKKSSNAGIEPATS